LLITFCKIIGLTFFYVRLFYYISTVIKSNNMRYLVRYWNGQEIINDLRTNNISQAIAREIELREKYGKDNAWMADAVQEIMVG